MIAVHYDLRQNPDGANIRHKNMIEILTGIKTSARS